jgi:glycosyltransferase involved in cell wall biosynthesis
MKISVVIPVKNENEAIGEVIRSVIKNIPDCEILVINDGSTDDTAKTAMEAGAKVINHPYNMGNGAAVKTGIRKATGDKIVLMDGDGQHNPDDIPALLEASKAHDMVVGARLLRTHANVFRRLANTTYNLLASYVTKINIKDLTSGFRVMDRETAIRYLHLLPNTFSYPTTITMAYLRSGRSICYIPVNARRRKGKSKISILYDGFRFLIIIIKIATLFSPLNVFLPVCFFFFFLGIVNYAYTYLAQGRFTNMSALLFITSVILFMMGLISEQITQLRYDRTENGG